MNAIQKAINVLRDTDIFDNRSELIAELEALLKQEPVAYMAKDSNSICHRTTHPQYYRALYTTPRPPCDLKALAEEIKESVINAWGGAEGCSEYSAMRAVDIDAIIQRHLENSK